MGERATRSSRLTVTMQQTSHHVGAGSADVRTSMAGLLGVGGNTSGSTLELVAAEMIAHLTGGRLVSRDVPGAAAGTHDFDINFASGRVVALEITTAVYRPWVVLQHRLSKHNTMDTSDLRYTWRVSGHFGFLPLRPGNLSDVTEIRRQAIGYLRELEAAGVDEFQEFPDERLIPWLTATFQGLRRLGITRGYCERHHTASARLIFNGLLGYSGAVSPETINRIVEAEIGHNHDKLARARADDRHLFIWVDPSIGAAGVSVAPDRLPIGAPTLPSGLDTVWLGFLSSADGKPHHRVGALWRCNNGENWQQSETAASRRVN